MSQAAQPRSINLKMSGAVSRFTLYIVYTSYYSADTQLQMVCRLCTAHGAIDCRKAWGRSLYVAGPSLAELCFLAQQRARQGRCLQDLRLDYTA